MNHEELATRISTQEKEIEMIRRELASQRNQIDRLQAHTVSLYRAVDTFAEHVEKLNDTVGQNDRKR